MSDERNGVFVPLPLPDERIFRYEAAGDVLDLLYRNPHDEFSVTELRETTGHGGKSVANAIRILGSLDLIRKERTGRRTLIRINRERLRKPEDSLLSIPQEQFRSPVKAFLDRVKRRHENNLVGVILFGSVARGEADRISDVDIQVIVGDELTKSRRELHAIRQEIENQTFDGERYELQLLVESVETASQYGEKPREIFSEGIFLYATDELDDLKEVILHGR